VIQFNVPGGVTQNLSNNKESEMNTISNIAGDAVLAIIAIFVLRLLFALPVMWLWNGCLVDAVSGLHQIGWLQAWGINILCGILFKSPNANEGN
jgi:hypothetical protein